MSNAGNNASRGGREEVWNVLKLLRWTQTYFASKDIEEPRLDAEILLGHSLGLSRIQLYTQFDRPLSAQELSDFKAMIKRRTNHEPVAYIVGEREFWSMTFKVDSRVLIPRPDTETVVELARHRARQIVGEPRKGELELSNLEVADMEPAPPPAPEPEATDEEPQVHYDELIYEPYDDDEEDAEAQEDAAPAASPEPARPQTPSWEAGRRLRIADIGTGSGAIAIALAKELPYADIVATDISEDALALARENAERLGMADRITFRHGDLLAPILDEGPGSFDIIVSNPPYIPEADVATLAPEVAQHEPRIALTPGASGLEALEALARDAAQVLAADGYIICEIGHDQGESAPKVFEALGETYDEVRVIRDRFSGQHRVVEARRTR